MTRPIRCRTFLMIAAMFLLSAALPVASQEPPPKDAKTKPAKEELSDEEKETRRVTEKLVDEIDVELQIGDKWSKVKRIEKPLLLFDDATRGYERGSLWAWGDKGRPVAVLELFAFTGREAGSYACNICNTSGGKVRASRNGGPWWRENDSDVVTKDIPQAPAAAAEAPQRQRRLKLLSQKFSGHEFWNPDNSRYELRRLERAVHTYGDEAQGLLEGGLFILANGTNPEILLFVEARVDPKEKSKAVWQFMVGRAAMAELHLEFDGKEVFHGPRAYKLSGPDKPFWVFGMNAKVDADPKK